jgi:hypothetical protein
MTALRLDLRASHALAGALALVHGAAAAALAGAVGGYVGAALALLVLALGAATTWDRALLRASGAVRALELADDGAAVLELTDGRRVAVRIGPRRHIGPWWVALPLSGAARRSLLVTSDMLPPSQYRFLKLWALWGKVPAIAQQPHAA